MREGIVLLAVKFRSFFRRQLTEWPFSKFPNCHVTVSHTYRENSRSWSFVIGRTAEHQIQRREVPTA